MARAIHPHTHGMGCTHRCHTVQELAVESIQEATIYTADTGKIRPCTCPPEKAPRPFILARRMAQ